MAVATVMTRLRAVADVRGPDSKRLYNLIQARAKEGRGGSVSPQRSNRSRLVEGTLRCLERLPPERITARAIAKESGANLASITYHFGSKDALVTEAKW